MKKKAKKTVVICSSAVFYRQVMDVKKELEKAGLKVVVPLTASKMHRQGDYDVAKVKTWFKNPKDYKRKTYLTKHHFDRIAEGDAILVLNYEKRGVPGYIGGAVLMEMVLACYLKKQIYVLNPITKGISFEEEVYGVRPSFLNGNLSRIK